MQPLLNREVQKYRKRFKNFAIALKVNFPKYLFFKGRRFCATPARQRLLFPNDPFSLIWNSMLMDVAINKRPPAWDQLQTLPHSSTAYHQRAHKGRENDLMQRRLVSNCVMDSSLNVTNIMSATRKLLLTPKFLLTIQSQGKTTAKFHGSQSLITDLLQFTRKALRKWKGHFGVLNVFVVQMQELLQVICALLVRVCPNYLLSRNEAWWKPSVTISRKHQKAAI